MDRKKKKKKKGAMPVPLPGEIIEEILLRIPAEYLVNLKSVCKDWFSLISGRIFAYAHLARHGGDFQQILVSTATQYEILRSQDAEDSKFRIKQKQLQNLVGTSLRFMNSCDGLLLFESGLSFNFGVEPALYICNPVTRKYSVVPLPKPNPIIKGWTLINDDCIGKYKMVGIAVGSRRCYQFTLHNDHNTNEDSQWRQLVIRQCLCDKQTYPAPVHNELHWLASEIRNPKPFLCSMDIAKEKFRETQVPFLSTYEPRRYGVIGMMGSLCITDYVPNHNELDIWCLEDRDKGMWTKKYSIKCEFELGSHVSFHSYPSVAAFTESRIIIRNGKHIFVYDAENKLWRKINFPLEERDMHDEHYNFVHINSLVKWG